jgi:REP element-mobilizing transposase RayT
MHERKHPIHTPIQIALHRPTLVFLTVCSTKHAPILANQAAMELIIQSWKKADAWHVGCYVIMPDHIHCFVAPDGSGATPLSRWVQYWKSFVSRKWPWPGQQSIWQKDFWDRQLRSEESYSEKWNYVRNNPVRHGMVARPEEWPFQGEITALDW